MLEAKDEQVKITTVVWDKSDLEDDQKLKLFVIDYNDVSSNDEDNKRILNNIVERNNDKIRTYQNTIVLLYPDYHGIEALSLAAKRVIACERALKDERINIDKDELKKGNELLEMFRGELEHQCMNTYSGCIPLLFRYQS